MLRDRSGLNLMTAAMLLLAILLAPATYAGMLEVDTESDADDSTDGVCSLREALAAAFQNADYNECEHDGGTAAPHHITFAGDFTIVNASGFSDYSDIRNDVSVDGSGHTVVIDGDGGAIQFFGQGASMTLTNGNFESNGAAGSGGAIAVTSLGDPLSGSFVQCTDSIF